MKKKKLFKSIILSAITSFSLFSGPISGIWMPTKDFHNYLCEEAYRGYVEGHRVGYIIDSIANSCVNVSLYNPDVAICWQHLFELCQESRTNRHRSTPVCREEELEYWNTVAEDYGVDMGNINIYSRSPEAAELRYHFLKIYKDNHGFKTYWELHPTDKGQQDIKEKWLSLDINTRIKIAKIYAISSYLDMIRIGMSKKLFSATEQWKSYDEIEGWLKNNVYCYDKKPKSSDLKLIFSNVQYCIDKIREISSWPN